MDEGLSDGGEDGVPTTVHGRSSDSASIFNACGRSWAHVVLWLGVKGEEGRVNLVQVGFGDVECPGLELGRYIDVTIDMVHEIVPNHFGAESLFVNKLSPGGFKIGTI